jgi:uncharacterized protein (TIGR03437 family)
MRARILLSIAIPLAALAQTISFLPPTGVGGGGASFVGSCGSCVVVADFNGDGIPDIAFTVLTGLPQGYVLLGNGDGTFRPGLPLSYPASGPLLVGDFNGDGKPDLVSFAGFTTIYTGKGDGTFAAPLNVDLCVSSPLVGDFNRDGKTDLICGTSLLLSNGDGSFRAGATVGSVPMENAILVADFNGDGIPDVMLHEISGILAVVPGHGDGTFGVELAIGYGVKPNSPYNPFLTGDFNGDGRIDLLTVSARGDYIDFLPGKGDGTFGSLIETDIAYGPPPVAMTAVGDFNKDGHLDFVSGEAVYAGNGDGTFRFPVFFGPTVHICGSALQPAAPSCDYIHGSTAVGDFNGDGLPDLAVYLVMKFAGSTPIHDEGEVDILLNNSPGDGFTASGISSASWTSPVAPGSIVSAFGVNLAPTTASVTLGPSLSFPPAPTTLGGIRVHVRDRSHTGDRLAPLIYVSPGQINYILNSTDPYAFVDIERVGTPYLPKGMVVPIAAIAPGFYPASYTTGAPGYLSLYGTGFAQASTKASSCTVGDVAVPVTYAGPEIQIAGLDQANLLLPASMAGAGKLPVSCEFGTADGVFGVTNTISVTIR